MHRKMLVTMTVFSLIMVMIVVSLPSPPDVQADSVLQDALTLKGYRIYFSETAGEASRFERGETGLSRFAGLLELLGADMATLDWRKGIPEDADLIIVAGPVNDLSSNEMAWLWAYLQTGGRLLLIADPFVQVIKAFPSNRGLFMLTWEAVGLRARDDVVVAVGDELRTVVPPADRVRGDEPTPTPMPAVEVPNLITDLMTSHLNTTHPIMTGVEGPLVFFGARSLEVDETPGGDQVTSLVYAGPDYYGETEFQLYLDTDYAANDPNLDTQPEELVLAAAMESVTTDARMVVIGDREFATNGGGLQTSPPYSASFLYPNNIQFLLNSVAWLLGADQPAALSFATPAPTALPTLTPTPLPTATATPEAEGGSS